MQMTYEEAVKILTRMRWYEHPFKQILEMVNRWFIEEKAFGWKTYVDLKAYIAKHPELNWGKNK